MGYLVLAQEEAMREGNWEKTKRGRKRDGTKEERQRQRQENSRQAELRMSGVGWGEVGGKGRRVGTWQG